VNAHALCTELTARRTTRSAGRSGTAA
jgi:hypothetical protein